MDPRDLLAMLDLDGKDNTPAADVRVSSPQRGEGSSPDQPVSPTALLADEWDLERGWELKCHNYELANSPLTREAITDFHTAAYASEPQFAPRCQDPRRSQFLKTLMETPDYVALRNSTRLNTLASEMAAVQFAKQFAALVQKDQQRKPAGKGPAAQAKAEMKAETDLLGAVAQALQAATAEVDEMEEVARGMGLGQGEYGQQDAAEVARVFKRVRQSPVLKRICELAGKFRRLAQSKQRQKVQHGYDEVIGVELAGDVARLLPVELASLADEDLELDTMRRLVERQTFCREYRGSEKVGKGPIVVCVDESGSMKGEPVAHAKAFALAMAWIAKRQGRWCALVGYSGGSVGTKCVLKPGAWNDGELLTWLQHFYGGGTTMDVPLHELPNRYWQEMGAPKGKTDVILITDGIVNVSESMQQSYKQWAKREKVRTISLILESQAGDLARVSDEVHLIRNIDTNEEAIGRCLSI